MDPVIKSDQSPYISMSNNPIIRIDPDGDDDFFDAEGNYVGSTAEGTLIRVINSNTTFEQAKSNVSAHTKLLAEFTYKKNDNARLNMLSNITTYYARIAGISKDKRVLATHVNVAGGFAYYSPPPKDAYNIAIYEKDNTIMGFANDRYNMINSFVHEKDHRDHPETWEPLHHVDAIITQANHSTFMKATSNFKMTTGLYAAQLLTIAYQKVLALPDSAKKEKKLAEMKEAIQGKVNEFNASPAGIYNQLDTGLLDVTGEVFSVAVEDVAEREKRYYKEQKRLNKSKRN